jgi:hypothetical protein
MNFDHYDGHWWVHFIEADCQTLIGTQTRYFRFATRDGFDTFVDGCNIEDREQFEASICTWNRGSTYCNLTDEQYAKLK